MTNTNKFLIALGILAVIIILFNWKKIFGEKTNTTSGTDILLGTSTKTDITDTTVSDRTAMNRLQYFYQIVKDAQMQLSSSRIPVANQIDFVNKKLTDVGLTDFRIFPKGGTPPVGYRTCDCPHGPIEISWWDWAFGGGCRGMGCFSQS